MSRVTTALLIGVVASAIAKADVLYSFEGMPANQTVLISFVLDTSDYLSLTATNNYQISIPCSQFSQETNCSGTVTFTNERAGTVVTQNIIIANGADFLFDPVAFGVPGFYYSVNTGNPTEDFGQLAVASNPGGVATPEPADSVCIGFIAVLAMGWMLLHRRSKLSNPL